MLKVKGLINLFVGYVLLVASIGREKRTKVLIRGSKELAVAENFASDFGLAEVPTKGS
jgi:hypothetical protein